MNWMEMIGLWLLGIGVVTVIGWIVIHRLDPSLSNFTMGLSSYIIRAMISFAMGLVTIAGSPIWIIILVIVAIRRSVSPPRTSG